MNFNGKNMFSPLKVNDRVHVSSCVAIRLCYRQPIAYVRNIALKTH